MSSAIKDLAELRAGDKDLKLTTLDVRGEACPEPVVKLAKVLEREAGSGGAAIVRVLTDSEDCVRYMKDMLSSVGITEYSVKDLGDYYELEVRVTPLV